MAKRELFDLDRDALPPLDSFPEPKKGNFFSKLFGVTKFVLGACLLPFVYSFSASFLSEFGLIEKPLQDYFWQGIIALLLIYLFVWEPRKIYTKGHELLEFVFSFFKPLVKVAPYVLPIYAIILFVLYWIFSSFSAGLLKYFMFLFGFTIALHLIFSAKSVRSKKGDILKGNYIFGFSLVYIINLNFVAICLSLIFAQYSFVNFFNHSFLISKSIFDAVLKQLFL